MGKIVIVIFALVVSLIIFIILFLRERSIRIASERCNNYYEKERAFTKTEIEIKDKRISDLKKEFAVLKKKNNQFFIAEVRYIRILRSHKKKIISLSKKNEGLNDHLINYDAIKIQREKEYTNLN